MDYKLALMTGIDIPIQELQVNIHQPTIKEISYIGEEEFFIALQYLTINKNSYIKDEKYLQITSNFDIFITLINDDKTKQQKEQVLSLLTILFPNHRIFITPQSIILNNNDGTLVIDGNNFEYVQEMIKNIFCFNSEAMGQNISFNPKGKKAKEIADKIMKGRKKISEEKGESKESILTRYLSVLAIGSNNSLEELINLTIFQIYDLMERYSMYMNWDIDIRQRLAGAKPEGKPENWMRSIH